MKKLICALIGTAALVASATTYIQTSSTGVAPWKPVKDSVSRAHLADSALKADSSRAAWKADSARIAWFAHAATYADSSRVSELADSAKRAGWAPLDSVRVYGISHDTANGLRSYVSGAFVSLSGAYDIFGTLASNNGSSLGQLNSPWNMIYGDTLHGFMSGPGARLGNESNDIGPTLEVLGSIYTEEADILLRNSTGYGSCIGFSDLSRASGYQRWNVGVLDDRFYIAGNNVDAKGAAVELTFDRSGKFTAPSIGVPLGTSSQFLKADGSLDTNHYATSSGSVLYSDSSRASHIADTAKKAGTSGNSLALGGIAASQYGTLTQDTLIAKKVASDTATVLRAGIASAVTTSEAYATARISDSLTANARAWTTLAAAKSSIHDTAGALRSNMAGYLPLTGGTMYGNLLGGTSYNIGATSNWWGSIYATTIYESNVALSSKYLGINASIPSSRISDWSTATSSFLTGNQSISLKGAVTGSGTTSIATSFANTHLAGINQELATTSSPTFGQASLGSWVAYPADFAWFGAVGQNNTSKGNSGFLQSSNGNIFMCAPSGALAEIQYNGGNYVTVSADGVSMPNSSGLAVTGPITANGGITGNLTGHASLDIPLTGSSEITGNLTPRNDALYDLGSGALQWNNIRGKTIYENGSQLASVYARLGSDNTYTGIQNTSGIVSDGNFFLRGFLSLNPLVITTDAARTIDMSMCNIVIYTIQQQYTQTLPDGTYGGQTLIVKNAQNVSGVTFGGKIAPGATLVPGRNTSIFVWNPNSNRWE